VEKLKQKPVEPLIIRLSSEISLRLNSNESSEPFFAKEGKTFEICPSFEQTAENWLKIRSKEDYTFFYLTIPEVERFPCPVRNTKPETHDLMSLYEVMIALLQEWENRNTHLRITSSIGEIFGKIGKIQNKIIQENFYEE
jgi:hypothetical protein